MEDIVFENNLKLMVGEDIINNLPYSLSLRNCEKAMIVCDEPAYRLGYVDMVKTAFSNSPIDIMFVYQKVGDIALDTDIEEIARKFKYFKCDSIIAIGKKSAVMAAKGAKILITEGVRYVSHYKKESLSDYPTEDLQLVVVPTNFGTGFEALPIARIYNKVNNEIYEFDTTYCATNILVLETKMTDIIPPKAIATYGLHALAMAMECYVKDETPMIAKAYADAAIATVYKYLIKCLFKNANKEYRQKIMEAVGFAGCGYAMIKKNDLLSPLLFRRTLEYVASGKNPFSSVIIFSLIQVSLLFVGVSVVKYCHAGVEFGLVPII